MDDTTDTPPPAVAAFLTDLAALAHKHRVQISGCGCCGSPWATEIEAHRHIADDAHYIYRAEDDNIFFIRDPTEDA